MAPEAQTGKQPSPALLFDTFNAYQRTYVITLRNHRNSYEYAKHVLEQRLAELKRISKGTNTKYLTLELLNKIRIAVPPEDLQREFSRRIAVVEKLKAAHRASLAEMDALCASLQHRALCRSSAQAAAPAKGKPQSSHARCSLLGH